ncbi:pentatricopeptide repeat-containing protein At5g15300 [Coffea eugenioides]|uniref:pentatricopeptide repeat-containing protein At5g15300 n=1 Tax=Coffea eugenioides TaxID=49369 RepID=UPI000F604CDC|nr:pentatricopeptide repeat-containing protein At5g15300 [Coffea eugenioides]
MIRKATANKSCKRHQRSNLWRNCTNFRTLKQIHALMVVNGFNSNSHALRELIYASAIALPSAIHYAHQLFAEISEPDIFMWNTLLRGSAQSSKPSVTMPLYAQMERHYVRPDCYTFQFVLKACTRLSWVNSGKVVHGKIVKHGFEWNKFTRNTLIYFHANCGEIRIARALFDDMAKRDVVAWSAMTAGYARRGELSMARRLFDEMPEKDLVSWNVMITGYVKQGEMESARELFDMVPKRDVVTWNAMISGYVLRAEYQQAFELQREMRSAGEYPDEVTMLSLLSACAESGALDVGEKLHSSILDMDEGEISIMLGNALIDMYAKCGSIEKAFQVFHGMKEKDVTSWNSILGGLAFHGDPEECINLFEKMRRTKFAPNEITFTGVLVACSHAGKVDAGRRYFNLMKNQYKILPNIRHLGCMVDMFGRAGLLEEAFEFIDTMEIKPNGIIWRTLLGACKIHGNVQLGRRANEALLKLDHDESGDYVLLSHIYALKGEWDGAEKVRKLMDDSGVKKEVGCSLIESENRAFLQFVLDSKRQIESRNRTIVDVKAKNVESVT